MVEMAWKAYAEGWMVEMDFHDGSSLFQDLVGEDGIYICELPKRGGQKARYYAGAYLSAVLIHRATPNQAEFEFDCISISKFLLCLCDDVCKKV